MNRLTIRLFGHIYIAHDGQPVELKARKALALLAWLVVDPHAHDRERLAAFLWPDADATRNRANLRRTLWTLNQTPIGPWIDATGETVAFRQEAAEVDVVQFERLLTAAAANPANLTANLAEAADHYTGDFLADLTLYDSDAWDGWARDRREYYRRQALTALHTLTQQQLDQGDFAAAVTSARRQLAIDNLAESAYQQLFLALAYSGQRTVALTEYETLYRLLSNELDVPPNPSTVDLIAQIRTGRIGSAAAPVLALSTLSQAALRPPNLPAPSGPPRRGIDLSSARPLLPTRSEGRTESPLAGQPLPPQRSTDHTLHSGEGWRELPAPPSPYRGLFAFREEDARYFFGREEFIDQLLTAAYQRPLVAVVGASGSGKSSVIYAGLVAALRREPNWIIAHFRPGRRPFQALAGALINLLEAQKSETERLLEVRRLAHALESGALSLLEVVDRLLEQQQSRQAGSLCQRLLLIIDQFEELYTLGQEEATREHFLDTLLALVFDQQHRPAPIFTLVFALRADFLGQMLAYRPLADALMDGDVKLGPMTRTEMMRAIVNPAHLQGVQFESGLVARILDDVGNEPGNLPLLEFALSVLWEEQTGGWLTHECYEQIGKVHGALTRHADTVLDQLTPQDRAIAHRIFVQVVRPGERTEDTRRLATRAELGEQLWKVTEGLVASRLLITGRDQAGQETVEIVHEALIRGWPRLQGWMAEDRAFRVWQERLRTALQQWEVTEHNAGALLRGLDLVTAGQWLAERAAELSAPEAAFIRASLDLRARQQRAQRQVDARRLAFLAMLADRDAAERASGLPLLLARQAVLTTLTKDGYTLADANNALRQAILNAPAQPRLRLHGHTDKVQGAAFSPDGQWVITASYDHTVGIWDGQTGQLRLRLSGHTEPIRLIALSPDGVHFATAGDDGVARIWNMQTGCLYRASAGHNGWIQSIAYSPDGALLLTGGIDGTAIVWDVASGQQRHLLRGHTDWVNAAVFHPSGAWIVTASGDTTARIWDTQSGDLLHTLTGHSGVIWAAQFSPNGDRIVTGSWDTTARIWDSQTRRCLHTLAGHASLVRVADFSPDGATVVTGAEDGLVLVWDVETGQPRTRLAGHTNLVSALDFNQAGDRLLTASTDGSIRLWDPSRGLLQQAIEGHAGPVWCAHFSPDDKEIVTASWDGTAAVWPLAAGVEGVQTQHLQLTDHTSIVNNVCFSPCGGRLISVGDDACGRVWDVEKGQLMLTLVGHTGQIWTGCYHPNGSLLLTASFDGTARLWDAESGEMRFMLTGHSSHVRSAFFSPDGQRIVTASGDCTAKVWETCNGTETATLTGHTGQLRVAMFSTDGMRVVTASQDGTARIWDAESGAQLAVLTGHTGTVWSASFSPNGACVVTSGQDKTARIWDARNGQLLHTLVGHTGPIGHDQYAEVATFSPNGALILTASQDATAALWEVNSGQLLHKLVGHKDAVWSAAFSPCGAHVVTASGDKTLKVWDVESAEETFTLEGHRGQVWAGCFSPDGYRVVSASSDNTVRLWPTQVEELLDVAVRLIPRDEPAFTLYERKHFQLDEL